MALSFTSKPAGNAEYRTRWQGGRRRLDQNQRPVPAVSINCETYGLATLNTVRGGMMMVRFMLFAALMSTMTGFAGVAAAQSNQPPDFHVIFEERCLRCHGHAGPFVMDALSLVDGVLVGSDGRPVEPLLRAHFGGLDRDTLRLFLDTFETQVRSGGLFRERCVFCHGPAYHFARLNLVVNDGLLTGRYSGRDIGLFLRNHGRLNPEQAARMTEVFLALLAGGR